MAEQLERFVPWADQFGVMRHAANSAGRARRARGAAGHGPLRDRDLRAWTRSTATRPSTGWSRRWSSSATWPRSSGRARATARGYGRRFIAERDTWIGDDPDRLRRRRPARAHRARARCSSDGRRVPLAGTVSMDNITVDLGDEPVERGTEAVLIGAAATSGSWPRTGAPTLGTINYEITCGLDRARAAASMSEALERRAARRSRARTAWLVGGAVRDKLLGRETDDVDLAIPGDPKRYARRSRARRAGRRSSSAAPSAPGGWSGPDHAWHVDLVTLRDDDIHADLAAARLHDQRDGRAARRRRAARPARRAARTSERRLVRMVARSARWRTTRCAACGRSGSRSSSTSRSTRPPALRPPGTRPGSRGWRTSGCSPSSSG